MNHEQHRAFPENPGWYCIGWDCEDEEMQAAYGPEFGNIYYFDGEDFLKEDGETVVDGFWDPILQLRVSITAADYYWPQS